MNNLQRVTSPGRPGGEARPAYRMFEGHVTPAGDAWGSWHPWIRAIAPDEVEVIANDLQTLTDEDFIPHYSAHGNSSEHERASEMKGVAEFVARAIRFLTGLQETERGFVYMIG